MPGGYAGWGSMDGLSGDITGAGPALVLLHGWGMGRHVWDGVLPELARSRRVIRLDLPGHGGSPWRAGDRGLEDWARRAVAAVDEPADWVGWSLGGLVAIAAAGLAPAAVRSLSLVAANPCFVARPNWPGVEPTVFDDFRAGVRAGPGAAHTRFLGYQVAGSRHGRSALRALRAAAERDGCPPAEVLVAGLDLLRRSDCRTALAARGCPAAAILGDADPLIPAGLADVLAATGIPARTIDGAGHAPFVSHPDRFLALLWGVLEA